MQSLSELSARFTERYGSAMEANPAGFTRYFSQLLPLLPTYSGPPLTLDDAVHVVEETYQSNMVKFHAPSLDPGIRDQLAQELCAKFRTTKRTGRPVGRLVATRRAVIQAACGKGLTGLDYCKELESKGLRPPLDWIKSEGCPNTYPEAYNHRNASERTKWQHRIQDEKSKNTRALRK